ncbi:hypothetical protein T01_10493 [Trichinella spiralis]|uniref:Uncharacterized protein n=1 Tax=Trichinella spiralis TaxID=6334 RepID=A0A0V1AX95_TRISP|nr:hypothetical protein T01_10493 [Trichinella spiralis]
MGVTPNCKDYYKLRLLVKSILIPNGSNHFMPALTKQLPISSNGLPWKLNDCVSVGFCAVYYDMCDMLKQVLNEYQLRVIS